MVGWDRDGKDAATDVRPARGVIRRYGGGEGLELELGVGKVSGGEEPGKRAGNLEEVQTSPVEEIEGTKNPDKGGMGQPDVGRRDGEQNRLGQGS